MTPGLRNIPNGCYINATLQLFAHIPELSELATMAFMNNNDKTEKQQESEALMHEWSKVHQELTTSNAQCVSALLFSTALCKYSGEHGLDFVMGDQSDATELFMFLLECIHIALCRDVETTINGKVTSRIDKLAVKCLRTLKTIYEKEYSEVYQTCYGIQLRQPIANPKIEHFNMLFVPIPKKKQVTLYECINEYITEETRNVQIAFWTLPDVLIIVLKRFDNNNRKIKTVVDFPLTNFVLSNYVCGYSPSKYVYNLRGVCNHHGTGAISGHYTASIHSNQNQWTMYNDQVVSSISSHQVVSANAYCLIYHKIPSGI